jgi:GABA permease
VSVRTPFSSEAEAFRFLLLTVAAFAAVALASILGGPWVGVPIWIAATLAAVVLYLRPRRARRTIRTAPAHAGDPEERRILVLANETLASAELAEEVAAAGRRARVLVVCPALTSAVRHWASDTDGGRALAERRLHASLGRLRAAGFDDVRGEVGDDDPLQALEDALRTFGADEIVVATHPDESAAWLERRVVERARERYALPVAHVVVA